MGVGEEQEPCRNLLTYGARARDEGRQLNRDMNRQMNRQMNWDLRRVKKKRDLSTVLEARGIAQEARDVEQEEKDHKQGATTIAQGKKTQVQDAKDKDQTKIDLELEVNRLEIRQDRRDLRCLEEGLDVRDLEQEARIQRLTFREMEVAMDTFGRDHYVLFGCLLLVVLLVWLVNNIVENLTK